MHGKDRAFALTTIDKDIPIVHQYDLFIEGQSNTCTCFLSGGKKCRIRQEYFTNTGRTAAVILWIGFLIIAVYFVLSC
ncbi:MAG: hypothetical protein ACTILG_07385, partial [Sphingobacterium sp.]